ncbi:MAG TPA: hypothetical protein HA254_06460 [Candidatus Diapherotrites archaeon]|uniref:Uncharacterized protein n=1 Tax=Candidatus Iainarchaeum sp. TaxID=3101447 RepID=A0A7J4IXZ8_9ARCH|nr:hypothetical protein [Candidatus Diapherotrites archaeon]
MEDEETTLAGKGFWTHDRIVFAIILLVGAIIGGIITHNYIDPWLSGTSGSDYNSMLALNSRLDARNDMLYSCLLKNSIDPQDCTQG